MWERQVLSAATTHSETAIKQAMMQSLKGQALMVTSALPPETSWEKLLQALKIKYQDKASCKVLLLTFRWSLCVIIVSFISFAIVPEVSITLVMH